MKKSLVIVGNGMATGRLLDELLAFDISGFRITVIGDEPHGSYNRIMLSSVLASDASVQDIIQKDRRWYENHGMHFYHGFVQQIDRVQKAVICEDGSSFDYDELVLATGARAASIPAANQQLQGVYAFRTIDDAEQIIGKAERTEQAVVIGGGLLGLEAAYGLAKRGTRVTLVHRSGWLLNRQLDAKAGALLQRTMAGLGIEFRLANEVECFMGEQAVDGVELKSGEQLDCQLAIIATGISPNAELGLQAGLLGQRAIMVDDYMLTSDPSISALGESVEHNGQTFGLVAPIWEQAKALASRLTNAAPYAFENTPVATKLKVSGVQVFSAGEVENGDFRVVCIADEQVGIYRKLLLKNGCIKGIVLYGDVSSGPYYFDLMQGNVPVDHLLPELILGHVFVDQHDHELLESAA